MWKFIILFTIFLAFILEPLLGLPLLLVIVISLSSFTGPKTGVLSSFICGLLADLTFSRPLGLTILFFLFVSVIIMLYKRRLKQESIVFMFGYSFLATNIYLAIFIRQGIFYPVQSFISALLVVALTYILYNLSPRS